MYAILIIINLFKTNALEDEHLLSPDKIYLAKKLTGCEVGCVVGGVTGCVVRWRGWG